MQKVIKSTWIDCLQVEKRTMARKFIIHFTKIVFSKVNNVKLQENQTMKQ